MSIVQTVLREIKDNELGFTLPHEHIFLDLSYYWSGDVKEIVQRSRYEEKVTLTNRSDVIYNPWAYRDNTILNDMDSAINELLAFKGYGGRSIADTTAYSKMGRDPEALCYVSGITGINVIMSSGRYSEPSMDDEEKRMSVADIEKRILGEFLNGVKNTGIKPGFIKVGFAGELNKECELNSLRAAARAQKKIGCAFSLHPNIWKCESHFLLDIIEEEGGDLRKVILCHQDFTGEHSEYHDSLVKRGVYIEFDTFGCECVADPLDINIWFRSDGQKIDYVVKQIELGNADHILLSGDMCLKIFFSKWGGWGYTHLPKHIFPRMRGKNISEENIFLMSVENPKRVFCH